MYKSVKKVDDRGIEMTDILRGRCGAFRRCVGTVTLGSG